MLSLRVKSSTVDGCNVTRESHFVDKAPTMLPFTAMSLTVDDCKNAAKSHFVDDVAS